jgi:SAM-dependent methyltransferase
MPFLDTLHGRHVFQRRVRVLSGHLAQILPPRASVLDVGCGDGLIARRILELRPDLQLRGLDVLVRPHTHIPVDRFDGHTLPQGDRSVDCVLFVDVLHHTPDPLRLLREAARVARRTIVLKDHTRDGLLAGPTLRFMDWVGNARHGVALPYNYWTKVQWHQAFRTLGLSTGEWRDRLDLYPAPASFFFERTLHFIARLDLPGSGQA